MDPHNLTGVQCVCVVQSDSRFRLVTMTGNDLLDLSREEHDESQDNLYHTDGRDTLRKTFCSGDSSSEEEDLGKYSDGRLEHRSLLKHSGHLNIPQADSGMRPSFLPSGQEGKHSTFNWEGTC